MISTIKNNIHLLRYEKNHDDLFEGCWPINKGVSINSYCLTGSKKRVLIDYVEAGADFDNDLASQGLKLEDFDILVLNHMEPDHTGALSTLFSRNPDILVYATRLGATETESLYGYKNVHVITNGEELDIGGMTLVFYATPNIHWPDTMMTYLKEEGILFSCDAFGAFGAYQSVYDDELTDSEWALLKPETERYYANIVASFSSFVLRGINALSGLDIRTICPSHGIVWRKDPLYVVNWYARLAGYAQGEREKEITILVSSMYGNTLSYVAALERMAKDAGITMMPSRLIRLEGKYHFLTERYDRTGGKKVHVQTLAAMDPEADSYEDMFEVCRRLDLPAYEQSELFRRMVFNIMGGNVDDHAKNFSFTMDENGEWHISPAYDMIFTVNPEGNFYENEHSLSIVGKVDGITEEDLVRFAKQNGIKNAHRIIEEVCQAITRFHDYASKYFVDDYWKDRVEQILSGLLPTAFRDGMCHCQPTVVAPYITEDGFKVSDVRVEENSRMISGLRPA